MSACVVLPSFGQSGNCNWKLCSCVCCMNFFCSFYSTFLTSLPFLYCSFCSSQRSPSPAPNHVGNSNSSSNNGSGGGQSTGVGTGAGPAATVPAGTGTARQACSFTPSLAAHFNENLIKHVQGWPAEHVEKQVLCFRLICSLSAELLCIMHLKMSFFEDIVLMLYVHSLNTL